MNTKRKPWQRILSLIVLLLLTVCVVGFAAYQYGCSFHRIFLIEVLTVAGYLIDVFALIQSLLYKQLKYDNEAHLERFAVAYLLSLLASVLFPLLPENSWMFPVIALAFSLLSNVITGILAFSLMLSISAMIVGADVALVVIYLLTGMIFIIVFDKLDGEFKLGPSLFISISLYGACIMAYTCFEVQTVWNYEEMLIPVINIFVTLILVLAVLRLVCAGIIDKEKDEYIDINDQEFYLLAKYKDENPDLYYDAIHTAYFAEKIARARHLDINLAKNGGYYHRIIVNECKQQNKTLEEICAQYKFPVKAVTLLQEINYKSKSIHTKETAVVYLSEAVISSLLYVIKKGEQNVDYGKVAAAVMKRRIDTGVLKDSDISLADIQEMEKIFLGEKLYYDFLRRE